MPDANLYELYCRRDRGRAAVLAQGLAGWDIHAQLDLAMRGIGDSGIGQGDVIGLVDNRHPGVITDILAAFRLGASVAVISGRLPQSQVETGFSQIAASATKISDTHWLVRPRPHWPSLEPGSTLLLTSGSTGTPKVVPLTPGNHLASATAANNNIPLTPGDAWLLSLSLSHVAGIAILHRCFLAGASVVVPATPDLAAALAEPAITHISLVPTQLFRLLQQPGMPGRLRRLKAILLGGAPASQALLRRAYDLGLPLHNSYGMTETASQVAATPRGAPFDALCTAGQPLFPGDVDIAPGGHIRVRGNFLFRGYWNLEGIARPFDAEQWFHTGDLGAWDAAGNLVITGRRDNQFQCGGENIQPEEIEHALRQLPHVLEAVVAPLADAEYGAVPVAYIRMEGAENLDAGALADALRERLPRHAIPRQFHAWPPEGNTGPSEKINRQALIRLANKETFKE